MIPIKTAREIVIMREACYYAAVILDKLCEEVKPGVSTYDIDQKAKRLMEEMGVTSACYNYKVGNKRYPGYICISVNEEVVHGIGRPERILMDGDAVSVDVSVSHQGYIGDNARTVIIEPSKPEFKRLLNVTEEALSQGIKMAIPNNRIGDVSAAIQSFVESHGFSVVKDFVGHGVGRSMHEEPQIPNYGRSNTGPKIKAGMTLAIEPMVNMGKDAVKYASDGLTVVTCDGLPAAHFEHTVLITENGPEILTIPKKMSCSF